jgi:hypothetical protein
MQIDDNQPSLRGMYLPDDCMDVEWGLPENGMTATSGQTLVATAGKTADSPAAKASVARLDTVGQGTIKPKHRAKIERRKLKYALRSAHKGASEHGSNR